MIKCMACFKELGKKDVVFTEENTPYCINPFTCNDVHPNSVANIVARGGAIKMYSEEELETSIFDRLNISDEMKSRIIKVTTKPQSIRLSKYDIAYYLIRLQSIKELASISEAVRYCVNVAMEQEPIDGAMEGLELPPEEESTDYNPELHPLVEQTTGVHEALTEPVVIEKSKGIKIVPKAKDLIMAQIDQTEEEDEF